MRSSPTRACGVRSVARVDARRRLGALGERVAAERLEAEGYSILERNFRSRHGELDLVAKGGGYLVFCEVKTRVARGAGDPYGPLTAVGPGKRRQLRRMAREWLVERAAGLGSRPRQIRFDAIGVTVDHRGRVLSVQHLDGAF